MKPLEKGTTPAKPRIVQAQGNNTGDGKQLETLLLLESNMRQQRTVESLSIWCVNELRGIIGHSQALLYRLNSNGKVRTTAISSLETVERDAPHVRWLERRVNDELAKIRQQADWQKQLVHPVPIIGRSTPGDKDDIVYPFSKGLLLLLIDFEDDLFGALLLTRHEPWQQAQEIIARRIASALAHSFVAILPRKKLRLPGKSRWIMATVVLAALAAMFIPVPMSTLAPAEIVARDPHIIAAPIDGVVAKISIDPNTPVRRGDILLTFEDTDLRAAAIVAGRRERVAEAKYRTARQSAFRNREAHRQLAVTGAEVALAQAESVYAKQKLKRSIVRSPVSGLLIYSDRKDWISKPVRTGERIMEIADTSKVQIKVDLPVGDAIALKPGMPVNLFLDARPLEALKARVLSGAYRAKDKAGIGLSYEILAELEKDQKIPRIGLRGTAKIFGDKVFLGFYLFRKPISSLRQYLGL